MAVLWFYETASELQESNSSSQIVTCTQASKATTLAH